MRRWPLIALVILVTIPSPLWAWGSRGHHIINGGAVDLLPEPLGAFFEHHRGEMVAHAVDPDIWVEHKVLTPPWTHFIDLENYGEPPFADIPLDYAAAVTKYSEHNMQKWGTLPWEIESRRAALTQAFRDGEWDDVIREATWLGHYIADSTMPLHSTKDYKGEKAGCVTVPGRSPEHSAHSRIEVGLLDHYKAEYGALRGRGENVRHIDLREELWKDLAKTYTLVSPALEADIESSKLDPSLGAAFYSDLERRIGGPMKGQITHAQELLASAWLSAWEDAGRPALPSVDVRVVWPDISAPSPRSASRTADAPGLAVALPIIFAILFFLLRAARRRC